MGRIRPVVKTEKLAIQDSQVFVVESHEIPSKFIPYDANSLEVRAFNLGELYYLTSDGLTDQALVELYDNVISKVSVYDLSWSDFLLLASHISLFTNPDNQWKWTVGCKTPATENTPACKKAFDVTLDRTKFFEFEDLDLPDYPLYATIKGKELEFGVHTVRDHLEYIETVGDIVKKYGETASSLWLSAFYIKNMEHEEAFGFIRTINNPNDIDSLREIDNLLYHDVKPIELTCPHCNQTHKYELGLEVALLRPFREQATVRTSGITFGKQRVTKHS